MRGGAFEVVDVAVRHGDVRLRLLHSYIWRLWWMGLCLERVEIIPNKWCGATIAENMRMSSRHFSWQALYFVNVGGITVLQTGREFWGAVASELANFVAQI